MNKDDVTKILKDKRLQWIVTGIIFLIILFMSSFIRLSNWDLLTDSTTGDKIPLALDPYYFLRIAETLVDNDGVLPKFDMMRSSVDGMSWHAEVMPNVVVGMWRVANVFGDYSLRTINVFSPVAFYFVGLIIFFFLVYFLTKSKAAGLLSSGLLAFSPSYLYRTMAGFSDHESIGMVALFACLLFYAFALKNFEKSWRRTILYALGVGFLIALVIATWGGAITFVFMMISSTFLLYWLLKNKDRIKAILFYCVCFISAILLSGIFNYNFINAMIGRISATYGLTIPAVLGFMLIDFLFEYLIKKGKLNIKEERKILYVFGTSVAFGSVALIFIGKNIFLLLKDVWHAVLFPFGMRRVDTTVAENAQPYLNSWISQNGSMIFWLFVFGVFLVGVDLARSIKSKKHCVFFVLSWIAMISCMLFSRISASSIFNGENFISQAVYLLGVGIFVVYFIWLNMYRKFDSDKLDSSLILLAMFGFITVLNGRSAIRTFFLIAPFVFLSVGYFVVRIFRYALKSRDDILKIVLWGIFLIAIVGILISMNGYRETTTAQAAVTGPSANVQWQGAMSWIRDNTGESDKFAHWWDYGYWVQTLGERPTTGDGGHFQGFYSGNERVGRYLLTTGNPATAYALMKAHNVSYLLIDQTDLGKYGAYSKIGSDDDWDRFSMIPVSVSDEKSVQETADGVVRIYQFGSVVDEDTYYNEIFLPGPSYDKYGRPSYKSYIGGVILNVNINGTFGQPIGVYVYNNLQYRIPLRYIYFGDRMYDFGSGLDATIRLIPAVQQSGQGMSINQFGAVIYLSPRTGESLFAKLYLMDDPFNEYGKISLAHAEDSPVVAAMKAQGAAVGDFIYYQGFRGPIKIWDVDYPVGTPVYEEFLTPQTGYGDVDWRFE